MIHINKIYFGSELNDDVPLAMSLARTYHLLAERYVIVVANKAVAVHERILYFQNESRWMFDAVRVTSSTSVDMIKNHKSYRPLPHHLPSRSTVHSHRTHNTQPSDLKRPMTRQYKRRRGTKVELLLALFALFTVNLATKGESLSMAATSSTGTTRRSMPSFYQRPLPLNCTAFSSPLGRQVFRSALQNRGLKCFYSLIEQHTTQQETSYCGLATLVVALNAMAIDPRHNWKNPWRWYHEELLQCCSDFDLEDVKKRGITMAHFRCLAICQGVDVEMKYADEESTSLDAFREAIRQVCDEETHTLETAGTDNLQLDAVGEALSRVLVVSYDRKIMGQTGSGHFAPIAAYDQDSDRVLILDTARFKYGCHWVVVKQLYDALKPIDSDSGRSRGYMVLTKNQRRPLSEDDEKPQILLRVVGNSASTEVKKDFLSFLESKRHQLTWDDFRSFWTKNNTDPGYIWYMCEPVVKPCKDEDIEAVDYALVDLRYQMEETVGRSSPESDSSGCKSGCRPNSRRTVPLLHIEAIYLVFLATRQENGSGQSDLPEHAGGELIQASATHLRKEIFQ